MVFAQREACARLGDDEADLEVAARRGREELVILLGAAVYYAECAAIGARRNCAIRLSAEAPERLPAQPGARFVRRIRLRDEQHRDRGAGDEGERV